MVTNDSLHIPINSVSNWELLSTKISIYFPKTQQRPCTS